MKALPPRKRFGQNFLVVDSVIDRIVAAVAPCVGDLVVEIGPRPWRAYRPAA